MEMLAITIKHKKCNSAINKPNKKIKKNSIIDYLSTTIDLILSDRLC